MHDHLFFIYALLIAHHLCDHDYRGGHYCVHAHPKPLLIHFLYPINYLSYFDCYDYDRGHECENDLSYLYHHEYDYDHDHDHVNDLQDDNVHRPDEESTFILD